VRAGRPAEAADRARRHAGAERVRDGPLAAQLVLGAITIIQQLDSHVVYPLVVGQTISLHPVAILLALAAGTVIAGVVGTLLAVPLAAIAWTIISYLRPKPSATSDRSRGHPDQLPPIRDPAATFP
jgi:predicted PurR-regulated permease PerM